MHAGQHQLQPNQRHLGPGHKREEGSRRQYIKERFIYFHMFVFCVQFDPNQSHEILDHQQVPIHINMSFIASLKIRMMQKKRKTRLNNVQEIAPQVKTFSQTFARCSVAIFISSFLQLLRREDKFVHCPKSR